jgi:hypothetical protein
MFLPDKRGCREMARRVQLENLRPHQTRLTLAFIHGFLSLISSAFSLFLSAAI